MSGGGDKKGNLLDEKGMNYIKAWNGEHGDY